jgi:hypothetical protein
MGDILGLDIGGLGSGLQSGLTAAGNGLVTTIAYIGVAILVCLVIAVGGWLWWQSKIYNKKIFVFENIGGQFRLTKRDTARLIKVGDGGEEILFLRKLKVYRTAYGKLMGKNEYWFAVGQDGYWYNITLGDLDAKMGLLDIEPVDRDMRYMHVAIRKNIQERYRKQNFMEKYGSILMNGIFLIIMMVGLYFLIKRMVTGMDSINAGLEMSKQTMEVMKGALANVDKICSGGGGYIGG